MAESLDLGRCFLLTLISGLRLELFVNREVSGLQNLILECLMALRTSHENFVAHLELYLPICS